ncbi:MAG: CaiB/BaiF CoA transferase family protein [Hyphomonadaceae bacterium]
MTGPLSGVRILEIGSIGPGPFAAMMLADHGADVLRIERPGETADSNPLFRSRRTLTIDLKSADGVAHLRALAREADGLIEGFRPGTTDRLGFGPDVLLADNPRLVYGRMTGWGQTGPYSKWAGHDINYIALSGALHAIGPAEKPYPPLALVGDFGGGGMMLAFGMVSALLHARQTGQGQVIDCAMTEGSALLMAPFYGMLGKQWFDERGVNVVDGGAPFYDAYETADGKYVAVGSIEPQFYRLLREKLGVLDDPAFDKQMDRGGWPDLKAKVAAIFKTKTREEWCALMEGTDVCFSPILSLSEAPHHPHNRARASFVELDGIVQPAPAPRYSATTLSAVRQSEPAGPSSKGQGAWPAHQAEAVK